MLWPDSIEGQARTNLRHLLHLLRAANPALERFLDVTPHALRWRYEAGCWVDVAAFEAALARAVEPDLPDRDAMAVLRDSIELYAGDLLEGCYDDWILEERERLRDCYLSALQRLMGRLADVGDRVEAIRVGRQLLRGDPLNEHFYRQLMRLYHEAGDPAGALRVYHECVTTLLRELNIEPSDETMRTYQTLLTGHPSARSGSAGNGDGGSRAEADVPSTLARLSSAVGGTVLVGRAAEWDELADHWSGAERGQSRLVLVTGEPGIGKTHLVETFAAWCAHRGALSGQARSYATEGELGYGVAIGWLRCPEVTALVRRLGRADRAELANLLPELGDFAVGAGLAAIDEAEQRRRLFDVIGRTISTSARPVLLVADDAQWCDSLSLQLIHYLVRLTPSPRLLVLATVRREDLDDAHTLDAITSGLRMIDRAAEVPLGRLARADIAALVRELGRREPDPTSLDRLHAETEGNPLFIVEAMRAGWGGAGPLSPDGERSRLTPKLQAVIGARINQLSESTRVVLGVAATVGREFTTGVLHRAAGLDDLTLVRGLDELWRRGIIRELGSHGYDFSHGKIRDVAYEGLSPAVRARNHAAIAGALQDGRGSDVESVSGQVAHHYDRGGFPALAVEWYQRAALQARRINSNVEAIRLLDRAEELLATLPEGAERLGRELEVLSALPTPLAVVEGFASRRLAETQQRVLQLASALHVEPEPELLRSLAMTSLCHHDFDRARGFAGRLRGLAEDRSDHALLVESAYLMGIAAFWDGAFLTACRHFDDAITHFDPAIREEHLLRFGQDPRIVCRSRQANALWFLGRTDEAVQARDEAIAAAAALGHPFTGIVTLVFAAVLSVDMSDMSRYREFVEALSAKAEHQPVKVALAGFLAYADVLEGHAGDGIAHLGSLIAECESVDKVPGQRAILIRLLVGAHEWAGDAERGLDAIDDTLRLAGTRIWEAEIRRVRATFLAARGAADAEVDLELSRAAEIASRQGATGVEDRLARTRAELRPHL